MSVLLIECKYVTDEWIREWRTSSTSAKIHIDGPLTRFIYELCWTVVRGDLPCSKCWAALDAVGFSDTSKKEDIASFFADTIAHMGQELTLSGELRNRLIELAKWFVDAGLVPVKLFQERCEAEFLWEADMIKIKAPDLKAKEVRVNTRLLYQQTKFNLLREESEGYAKLLTLLSQQGPDGLSFQTAPMIISTMKSLIGHFDLDPNRVFDIVLECFEQHLENMAFLELIPLFPKSHISHILGFKFQYYQRFEVEDPVPIALYRLAATLIKADFIELDSIYPHLVPKDEDAIEQYEEILRRRMEEANKIGKINLAATGRDLMEEEKPGDVTIDLYAVLDMENEAVAERSPELVTNQKLGLLDGFLFVDDWPHAYVLLERLSPLNPVSHQRISAGILRAIEKAILSNYERVRPVYLSKVGCVTGNGGTEEIFFSGKDQPSVDLRKEFFQMLICIGPYLHRDILLLQKVCRVLRDYYSSAQSLVNNTAANVRSQDVGETERKDARVAFKEARLRVEEALGSCILPSLQLLPANPAVGLEIWEIMSLLPYEVRYRLYGEWEKDDEAIPMLLAARQTAKLDTRRILKRLAKENLKQLGRMVAKIAHANPMTVLRTIVHQIEAYKDMIAPVVDAFKYLTQLEYDVLEYVVLERLAQGGREKLKEDGLNLSDWLQSLASFWGHLCKKYPSMELRGLFQYLANQLKKGEGIELVILQELIQQMSNVEYTENVAEDQLEAMAGGETLRSQATTFGITRNNKALIKSTNRLRDSLLSKEEPKLAVPLLLLIAQHRSNIILNADAPYIKMVSEQYDRCHGTLLQYVEFLMIAVSPVTAYAQLLPSLEDLIMKYHIEPEVAFLIYRPVMRLFRPSKGSTIAWPADTSKIGIREEDNVEKESAKLSSDLILDIGAHRKPLMWSELLATIHSILPPKSWNSLSPELYVTFWGLNLHDLYVPRKRYEFEIAKQRTALKSLEENSDNSHAAIAKRKKDKEKIQEILDRLSTELQKQEQNVTSVHHRLVQEKDSWLTSCPDPLKINMEFLQRCIFPRCVFSMMDAVYCARFVHTLHSLGTPFFNTVNHIDVLICKTLQPMICCCTEYEAGRLGRFLYETLKMAYLWKSNEDVYDRECGNMPGFAVLYKDPNSPRVTFSQYIRVHWKWSSRLTKLLIQCLESNEYMEIRNALTLLTKISSVFPVMKKSGMNIERRVSKIKGDEREDLKVLATGVSASLASRKNAWVTDEEFGMGYIDIKPTASPAKRAMLVSSGPPPSTGFSDTLPPRISTGSGTAHGDAAVSGLDSVVQSSVAFSTAVSEFPTERVDPTLRLPKHEHLAYVTGASNTPGPPLDSRLPFLQSGTAAQQGVKIQASLVEPSGTSLEASPNVGLKGQMASDGMKSDDVTSTEQQLLKAVTVENETRSQARRATQPGTAPQNPVPKSTKTDVMKEDSAPGISVGKASAVGPTLNAGERDSSHVAEGPSTRQRAMTVMASSLTNGSNSNLSLAVKSSSNAARGTIDRVSQENASRTRTSGESFSTSAKLEAAHRVTDFKGISEKPDNFESRGNHQSRNLSKSPSRKENLSVASKIAEDIIKERQLKKPSGSEDADRVNKRRKNETGERTVEAGEFRVLEKERSLDTRSAERSASAENEKILNDERPVERSMERLRERAADRNDRDHRGEHATERIERDRGEDYVNDKLRDRSSERFARERSLDKLSERGSERPMDKGADRSREDKLKDDRVRSRYGDTVGEQPHPDDRYPMQNLPPPPPLPPNLVPLSVSGSTNRREEETDRRGVRSVQRASPHHDEKPDKKRNEEGSSVSIDEPKRRRDEDVRDRKRDEREILALKAEKEREREREKTSILKEEAESAAALSKRRKLKRDHLSAAEMPVVFGSSSTMPPPVALSQAYDGRDRDRKGSLLQRTAYIDEPYDKGPGSRVHSKDGSKMGGRDHEQIYDRDWEDDKRQRADLKRRHHRK
ncbi:hypothetical protein O6H91_04G074300 [Diphasiastrum complanatum]|uniref:Uncharacterized protein n=14 Tax=Diphasiastrum complanatum TaxID=34168 RepID=A0ACC2DYM3_DIPCM|nr:hypothetical protein O6H91_04G074300 [Diphasiastrum complanatum]KAJ7559202.1 hypothetical protein O6H91_04G074300 [Diphasiastrum complanatum]KAJ7559203.1 hypothetical protein O6H91_04G074300 [Diphasiastrum complanatum]KAJ7559204.1 hypothetical protein O6H91_04G074300 [Diphasiastrum complanatum]KAJ7559205.1 hypothetical protein O6H91_04G074300 [Diphasiastrum complanatum]